MKKVFSGYLMSDEFGFLCVSDKKGEWIESQSLAELVAEAFPTGTKVFVRYFISDKAVDESSLNDALILKNFGYDNLEANYVLEAYSEVTIDMWEEDLKIGGHDLIVELHTFRGKYLTLIIETLGDGSASPYGHCL